MTKYRAVIVSPPSVVTCHTPVSSSHTAAVTFVSKRMSRRRS